eukprot:2411151-Rhodomonas_salina.2
MEEPPDRERSRRDEMTPRRAVCFVEEPEGESGEELRPTLDEAHNLEAGHVMEEDFREYQVDG